MLVNSMRLMYQAADPAGLQQGLANAGLQIKADLSRPVFKAINIPIESSISLTEGHTFNLATQYYLQEDVARYGPVGFLILFPAMLVGLV